MAVDWTYDTSNPSMAVVAVTGELDLHTANPFAEEVLLAAACHDDVVVDVSGLSFCDSAGLRALLTISRDRPRGRVVLRGPRPHLRSLLELTALDTAFEIEP